MALESQLSIQDSLCAYVESLLTSDDKQAKLITYVNDASSHAELMLKKMHDYFVKETFCDVTLVAGDGEIKAHRFVLCSCSLYFRGLFDSGWEGNGQDRFEITQFGEATLKSILNFVYTANLHINTSNVIRVLAASDFLQLVNLDFVEESCADYLSKLINKDNCVVMLSIAEQFNAVKLKGVLLRYFSRNFYEVCLSKDFTKLPVDFVVKILQSESLIVDLGKDFLPPSSEQEDFILDNVLRFVSHQCEDELVSDSLLAKLIRNIRLRLLSPSSMVKLRCHAAKTGCSEATKLIEQAKGTRQSAAPLDRLYELWKQQRKGLSPRNKSYRVYANKIYVGPLSLHYFGNESFTKEPDLYVNGMKIWVCLWDIHLVIGGFQVFYSNGESPMYGGTGNDEDSEFHEFHLDSNERITKAVVKSDSMIDSLTFFTNKGQELGPYGGTGGDVYTEQPKSKYGFLSHLKGGVLVSEQTLAITRLRLVWKEFVVN